MNFVSVLPKKLILAMALIACLPIAACAQTVGDDSNPVGSVENSVGSLKLNLNSSRRKLQQVCRADVNRLCADAAAANDRRGMLQCLATNQSKISSQCRDALKSRRQNSNTNTNTNTAPVSGKIASYEYAYGKEPLQNLQFIPTECLTPAPLVVFIHGGSWARGDKDKAAGVKTSFFKDAGYNFATVNYRLRPSVEVSASAQDIANAIAWLQQEASRLNVDPSRIVLQGHSSGAHLAALVALDPRYLEEVGVDMNDIKAVSLLDGAGYNINTQIEHGGNARLYRRTFGDNPEIWSAMSPTTYAANSPSTASFVIHYISGRLASQWQSNNLAEELRRAGQEAIVYAAKGKTHASLNKEFGNKNDTPSREVVDFLTERVPSCSSN